MIERFDIRLSERTLLRSREKSAKVVLFELNGLPSVLIAISRLAALISSDDEYSQEIIESSNNGTAVLLVSAKLEIIQ